MRLPVKTSFVVILAAGLLLSSAAGSAASAAPRAPISGVVAHAAAPHAFGALAAAGPNDVALNTQPCDSASWCWVMRTNTVYAIYWTPAGSTCGAVSCASYENTVNRYFTDVAAASGSNTNVYSDDTQYYDATGKIAYDSTFGGSYVDTSAFPANGCTDGSDPVCVSNQALEAEIQSAITAKHWPDGKTSLFFILLPSGIGSCYGGTHCTTDPVNGWCAYHSGFMGANSSPILYAAEPFDGTITGCHGAVGQGFPNGTDADATINTISHEQNEAITDPWGNAWFNGNFEEIGDLCAWTFGSQLGTAGNGQPYNQLIDGHPYSLQQEYSNDGSTCVQRYGAVAAPANSVRPVVAGTAAVGRVLSTTNGTWTGSPSAYAHQWQRCAANGTGCTSIGGATGTTYAVAPADVGYTLEARVSATNAATTATATSTATAVVVAKPSVADAPHIAGKAKIGKRLAATTGTWTGLPAGYQYAWLRCSAKGGSCVQIRGATAATYAARAADRGHRLRVRVTAVNVAGSGAATSSATARVPAKR
jgi:hypothetical protein